MRLLAALALALFAVPSRAQMPYPDPNYFYPARLTYVPCWDANIPNWMCASVPLPRPDPRKPAIFIPRPNPRKPAQ